MLNICKILLICHWFYVIVLASAYLRRVPDTVFHELLPLEIFHVCDVVLRECSLYDTIRASISIPIVFTPVEHGDMLLVNGGITNDFSLNRGTCVTLHDFYKPRLSF